MLYLVSEIKVWQAKIALPKKFVENNNKSKQEIIHILNEYEYKEFEKLDNIKRVQFLYNNQ